MAVASARAQRSKQRSPWLTEIDNVVRAFSGAFIFGIPLLFTMEMWWIGTYADFWKLFLFLLLAIGANAVLNYFTGFKRGVGFGMVIDQTIDAVAVGVVSSVVVLLVLNRINLEDPLGSNLGKIVIQTIPLSIGASVANAIFGRGKDRQGDDNGPNTSGSALRETLNDFGATVTGGLFLGFSIAPTEEVRMLATEIEYWHELALIGLSLLISYGIVFVSAFSPLELEHGQAGPFQRPITETVTAYILSLIVAGSVLFLFDQITLNDPLPTIASQTLVLGLPTTIGGAAGRLVI